MSTAGTDLMNQLHSGELAVATPKIIKDIRDQITTALEEVVEVGARIRPLNIGSERVGWIRGLYYSERKLLMRWYPNVGERTKRILMAATTLTEKEIKDLDGFEFRTLLRKVVTAEVADTSLFPFLSPFVTTSASEALWYGLSNSTTRKYSHVDLLDGHVMKFLAVPDHCRLWLLLCNYREQAKRKLAGTQDASLVARAFIGKGAQRLLNDLNKAAKSLMVDIDDPWKMTIRVVADDLDLNDGWGHAHIDTSEEGLLRECSGMAADDKHEQFMEKFYTQQENWQRKEAEEQLQNLQRAYAEGVVETEPQIMTEAEVMRGSSISAKLAAAGVQMARNEMASIDDVGRRSQYGDEDLVPVVG